MELKSPNFVLLEKPLGIVRMAYTLKSLGGICPAMFTQCFSTTRMFVNEPAHVVNFMPMHHYPAFRHGIVKFYLFKGVLRDQLI